jgi:hypothetical protein
MTEAGRLMGRHRETMRALVKRGAIEGVEMAGRLYTSAEAIRRAVVPVEEGPQPASAVDVQADYRRAMDDLRRRGMVT